MKHLRRWIAFIAAFIIVYLLICVNNNLKSRGKKCEIKLESQLISNDTSIKPQDAKHANNLLLTNLDDRKERVRVDNDRSKSLETVQSMKTIVKKDSNKMAPLSVKSQIPENSVKKKSFACPDIKQAIHRPKKEIFQPIAGSTSFVFSAYVVDGNIQLFIALNATESGRFSCQFWSHMSNSSEQQKYSIGESTGKLKIIPDDHKQEYGAAFITCKPPVGFLAIPHLMVSLTSGECHHPSNLLLIQKPGSITSNFVLCVAPIWNKFSLTNDLVEMIEMNRLLGADKFYFYNSSVAPNVSKVLQHYTKLGLAEAIQWHLPLTNKDNKSISMHYMGQELCMNECMYRNRNMTNYIVFTDIDEFIVPKGRFKTWPQLIQHRLNLNPSASSFMARNVYFRKDWEPSNKSFSIASQTKINNSVVLRYTFREDTFFEYGIRSKIIVNPRRVVTLKVHKPYEKPYNSTDFLPVSEAFLHHYRSVSSKRSSQRVVDEDLLKRYGTRLKPILDKRWTEINRVNN